MGAKLLEKADALFAICYILYFVCIICCFTVRIRLVYSTFITNLAKQNLSYDEEIIINIHVWSADVAVGTESHNP